MKKEHIAPYLAHGGLQMLYIDPEVPEDSKNLYPADLEHMTHVESLFDDDLDTRILLRPMSDLTKQIEHGGEKFVPIIELFKVATNENIVPTYIIDENDDDYMIYFPHEELVFGYHKTTNGFAFSESPKCKPIHVCNHIDLIQHLFAWHFDVFGLIGLGQAIDINTIK